MILMLDRYSLQARFFPACVTIAPIVFVLAATLPDSLNLPLGRSAAIVLVPFAFLLSQLGADCGKRLEKRLWCQWGGAPATRFLRHANDEFNPLTRQRIHKKLILLGLPVPSKDEEENNVQTADNHYKSCIEELIRKTRDNAKFPLVFKSLTEYGFCRNLLGLKRFGLLIVIPSFLVCVSCAWIKWNSNEDPAIAISTTLLVGGLFFIWLTWVNEKAVSLAANRYARFLLEAALELE